MRSLWSTPLLLTLLAPPPGLVAFKNLPPFDQKRDSKLPSHFLSWGSCAEPGISLETPWLRATWKTMNLQGCTKHSETEKPAGTANSIFTLHIQNSFLGLGFHCCHKTRRGQLVLHGKQHSQTHLPFQRHFWVDFHSSQEYPCTFLLSRAWLHPRRTWQLPGVARDHFQSRPQPFPDTGDWSLPSAGLQQGLREVGYGLVCHPLQAERERREKLPITTEHILTVPWTVRVPSAFLWLTHFCLLQPYEEGGHY